MNDLEFHEIANIFPLIRGDEFVELKADIKANGLIEKIWLYEDKILDGRNRYRACQEVGEQPVMQQYAGDNPVGFVISLNACRRHLNPSQKATASVKALPMFEAEAKKRQVRSAANRAGNNLVPASLREQENRKESEASEQAAKATGASARYVQEAKKILKESPDDFDAINDGTTTIQKVKAKIKTAARIADIASQEKEIVETALPVTARKYHVISIDPPWPYEGGSKTSFDPDGRRVANPYPEMSIEAIKEIALPVNDDAILWLWTTHKFLPDSFEILKAWGFDYRATMVWDKESIGMGHWLRMQCEFCLLATKGSPVWSNTNQRDIIAAARREHSRKPDEFFKMVDNICVGAKLEYFSREQREGWDVFGNDTDKF